MKRGEKILILAAALLLAVAGFNLVASTPSQVVRANRPAHYEIVVTASAGAHLVPGISG